MDRDLCDGGVDDGVDGVGSVDDHNEDDVEEEGFESCCVQVLMLSEAFHDDVDDGAGGNDVNEGGCEDGGEGGADVGTETPMVTALAAVMMVTVMTRMRTVGIGNAP